MSGLTVLADTEIVRVRDVAEQVRGVSYSKADVRTAPQPGYIPLLRGGNVREHGLAFDDLQYVPEAGVSQKQILRAGDILVVASSGSLSGVGKAACVPSGFRGTFGAFCKVIRPTDKIDASYLGHYFRTADYRSKVSSMAGGANINNLRNEHLDGLRIRLPALHEQRRVAAILDKADELRTNRRQALAHLNALTQSIFHSMFGNRTADQYIPLRDAVAPGTIVTYGIVQAGDDYPSGVPYVRTGDIRNGRIAHEGLRLTNPAIAAKFARSRISTGDIVMSIRATVGTVALTPRELDGANLTQGTARIAPGPETEASYLLEYLRSPKIQQWIQKQVKGATFKEITLDRLRQLPVSIPGRAEQLSFGHAVSAVEKLKDHHHAQLRELDTLFASLQHRAFNGKLR